VGEIKLGETCAQFVSTREQVNCQLPITLRITGRDQRAEMNCVGLDTSAASPGDFSSQHGGTEAVKL